MRQPVFYFQRLKTYDVWAIFIYIIGSIGLYSLYSHSEYKQKIDILLLYAVATQLLLYFALYVSLRNLTSYLIWCFIGLTHLAGYFYLKNDPSLQMINGHAAKGLKGTIILLLVFQLLRLLSLNVQHQEFVVPSRGSKTDLFDERRITIIDILILFVYFGVFIVLAITK